MLEQMSFTRTRAATMLCVKYLGRGFLTDEDAEEGVGAARLTEDAGVDCDALLVLAGVMRALGACFSMEVQKQRRSVPTPGCEGCILHCHLKP